MTKSKRKPGKHALAFSDKHLTKQDHGGSADPNFIAQQYAQGRLPYPENPPLRYGDISAFDLQKSRELLAELDSSFAELPSELRAEFQTTESYVAWMENNQELIEQNGLRDALWTVSHPPEAESGETPENAPEGEIRANDAENGATGDDPPAT